MTVVYTKEQILELIDTYLQGINSVEVMDINQAVGVEVLNIGFNEFRKAVDINLD